MTPFDPAQDTLSFRKALGRFATGVTIVTAPGENGPVGMTANSFASLSLTPPLIAWSVARHAGRAPVFTAAQHFAIHILAEDQEEIARAFTTRADAFGELSPRENPQAVPLFDDCLARFECERVALHDAGDHHLIIGRVTEISTREGAPLIFHDGTFHHGFT